MVKRKRGSKFLEVFAIALVLVLVFYVYSSEELYLSPNLKSIKPVSQFDVALDVEGSSSSNIREKEGIINLQQTYCLGPEDVILSNNGFCDIGHISSYISSQEDAISVLTFKVKLLASVDCAILGKDFKITDEDLVFACNNFECSTKLSYYCEGNI